MNVRVRCIETANPFGRLPGRMNFATKSSVLGHYRSVPKALAAIAGNAKCDTHAHDVRAMTR